MVRTSIPGDMPVYKAYTTLGLINRNYFLFFIFSLLYVGLRVALTLDTTEDQFCPNRSARSTRALVSGKNAKIQGGKIVDKPPALNLFWKTTPEL